MTISNNGPGKEVQEGKSKLKCSFLRVYHAVSLVLDLLASYPENLLKGIHNFLASLC